MWVRSKKHLIPSQNAVELIQVHSTLAKGKYQLGHACDLSSTSLAFDSRFCQADAQDLSGWQSHKVARMWQHRDDIA
jgi:hypothetical protein